jgi:flagellar biosynthesis anti-sigma factor FlgM
MKVTNTGNKDAVELSHVAKNRKAKGADGEKARTESSSTSSASTNSVELSSEAKAMAKANGIAKSEDIDQAKVDRVKAMIANKKYNPDYGKVADKVVNETLLQEI